MITKPNEPSQNLANDELDTVKNQTTDNPKKDELQTLFDLTHQHKAEHLEKLYLVSINFSLWVIIDF